MADDYERNDALGLAELVRTGQASPAELLDAAIARADRLNPRLNAIIHRMDDQARQAIEAGLPDGPFRGVPFLIKDLLADYAGAPIQAGSRLFSGYRSTRDSEVVSRFKASGLAIFGKTNTPEFGLLPVTEPAAFGPTRNPWDLDRTPGGSSGGSAAAVAARIVPMANGGDGGGSIRIPAACCGLFGLKPSRGRVPTGPERAEVWAGAVAEHVLTRSVRDSAAMLDVLAGPDVGAFYSAPPPAGTFLAAAGADPPPLRIAVTAMPFLVEQVDLHPACRRGLEAAKALLTDLGHHVEEAAPTLDRPLLARSFLTMLCVEMAAELAEAERLLGRKVRFEDVEPGTWALKLLGAQISGPEHALALRTLQRTSRQLGRFFTRYDVLLTPTLAAPPLPIGSQQLKAAEVKLLKLATTLRAGRLLRAARLLERNAEQAFAFTPYTPLFNASGQPAMSVPLHWDGDLPIGMQFVGRYGEETTLLRLAGQLERARPWIDRVPPILTD